MRRSLSASSTSTSSASGSTATVTAEVWMRPCVSVTGTRCTRCTPPSNLRRLKAPFPATSPITSLKPPRPVGVARVHAEELGGEEARLVAARAGTDLEHRVARVVGVLGEEELLEGCVELGQARL